MNNQNNFNSDTSDDQQMLTKKQRRDIKRQEKLAARSASARKSKMSRLVVALVIIIAVVGVGVLIFVSSNSSGDTDGNVDTFADPTLGPAEATVLVEEFSDFQCPACRSAEPAVKQLLEQYGDQIQFVYQDFPLTSIHPNAKNAAIAGQCALAQSDDYFWELHDLLFSEQDFWANKSRGDAKDDMKSFAGQLEGLDQTVFDSCLDNKETEDAVDEDISEGNRRNVSSTPTFFVDDERVVGGSDLLSAVEQALEN